MNRSLRPGHALRMGTALRRWVPAHWSSREEGPAFHPLDVALAPAEMLFRGAVRMRSAWYDRAPAALNAIPVVSIGNLTVGGTGKTPVVRWVGDWLRARGVAVAIVTRGYGADEIALHRTWFGAEAVQAGRNRRLCVRAAAARSFELALVDDGFQHRALKRDLDILLVAAGDSPQFRMLPRGPGREPPAAAARADFVVMTRRGEEGRRDHGSAWRRMLGRVAPRTPILEVDLVMGRWSDLGGHEISPPRGPVLAVCSVARPEAFRRGLARLLSTAAIDLLAFPDHHRYRSHHARALLARAAGRRIVCTAKDAVKLRAFPELKAHAVVVGFGVSGDLPPALRQALRALIRHR